ncbi:DUF6941 family protein [Bacillus sp. L_1B0_12]|uniref:DUF6941 family protein n=1 Tax=Bacillus sp. L_1B0_12 TaxID=1617024 RepID=UPI000626B58B|nr:hypothetical protein [Bacillus sp. L_1B0_12]KKK10328.1 hypothetical protein UF15_07455 [Bacillus sp. L_1B0_12]
MPTITSFIYCEKTETDQNGKLILVQPLLVLTPAFLPGMYSFSIAVGIKGIPDQMKLRILFISPDSQDQPLIDTTGINVTKKNVVEDHIIDLLPEEEIGINFNMDLRNVVLKTEGYYKTVVMINEEVIGEFPIYVKGKDGI